MVKTRSQMADNFAGPNSEFKRRRRWPEDAINVFSSIVINVLPEVVTVQAKKGDDKRVEPIDIVVGPRDLRPTPIK
jgi:hypothetical protein